MSDAGLPAVFRADRDGKASIDPAGEPSGASLVEVSEYIAAIADDLGAMARTQGLTVLAYLLDMAAVEARSVAGAPRR